RFGDGTEESHRRAQTALAEAWRWTGALHQPTAPEAELIAANVVPDSAALRTDWDRLVREVLHLATLKVPEEVPPSGRGYRRGDHTEHLGHLLSEMQSVARAHPGASW
ncbi:MAG: Phenylacetic acid catabolic protein, partial [Gemmatimonadota bacterium]